MPASDISRISISGVPRKDLAARIAKDVAQREIALRIKSGILNQTDPGSIEREYRSIYSQEYYKYYASFLQQDQRPYSRIIYVPTENPAARKYYTKHTAVRFSRLNCFIHVHKDMITVGRIDYPLDGDLSPETQESFISQWPGPLDKHDYQLDGKVTGYLETLWQHDSQRRIRYCNTTNDDHRKTILELLRELLHRKGTIDAPGVSRLLLKPEDTDFRRDESGPLTLQKYLLSGKRSEAIKFAKSKNLWDHAQCLAFLDKYQPPKTGNYIRDPSVKILREDPIVQLNDEYINAIGATGKLGILSAVYRSLLNRIIQSDPESISFVKLTNVENDAYNFAIMCANDCEIEFDRSNEVFKLIMAIKQAKTNPTLANSHLISLGFTSLDSYDPSDDISARSLLSFRQVDTPASRTLTISNIDMLILNEIWEYCLNLPRNSNQTYRYILDLVPYKLVFASRLLDFGLHTMFANYLQSIKQAIQPLRSGLAYVQCDPFYDWSTIIEVVDYLDNIWSIFCPDYQPSIDQMLSPDMANLQLTDMYAHDIQPPTFNPSTSLPSQVPANDISPVANLQMNYTYANETQSASFNPSTSLPNQVPPGEILSNDYPDTSDFGYTSMPYAQQPVTHYQNYAQWEPPKQNIPPQFYSQPPIQEEVNDFNPEPTEPVEPQVDEVQQNQRQHSNDISRRQSSIHEAPERTGFMTSSSPVAEKVIDESLNSPFSPINEHDDLPRRMSENGRSDNNASNSKSSQPAGDQQPGFLYGLTTKFSSILPRSQSKQMILPDDNPDKQNIVFDEEKNCWVDKSKPDGGLGEAFPEPPPMMKAVSPPEYSANLRSSKMRYARP